MMTEVTPEGGRSRESSSGNVKKHFEEAVAESRTKSQEKIDHLKQQTRIDASFSPITGRWNSALEGSKEKEQRKLKAAKLKSLEIAEGLVSSRVNHWEQYVLQAMASKEQIDHMIKNLMHSSSQGKVQVDEVRNEEMSEEEKVEAKLPTIPFTYNSTCSYHFEKSSSIYRQLKCILDNSSDNPVALTCGLYMSSSDSQVLSSSCPTVMALAITDEATQDPCIAVTFSAQSISGNHPYEGPTKLALFTSPHDKGGAPGHLLWEAVFDLKQSASSNLLKPSIEVATSVSENIIDDRYDTQDTRSKPSLSKVTAPQDKECNMSFDSETSFGRGRGEYVSDSDSSVDEGVGIWTEVDKASKRISFSDCGHYDTDLSSVSSSLSNTPRKDTHTETVFSLEGGLPEIKNYMKRSTSVNENDGNRELGCTGNIITMDSEPIRAHEHDVDKECQLDDVYTNIGIDVNAFDISSSSASDNVLIIKSRADGCSHIITSDAKHASYLQVSQVDSSTNIAVIKSTLVEWSRAVAKSGWIWKWPMEKQKAGFRTKRFLILRDRILSYHKHEPRSQAEAQSDYAMHSIQLKHYFTIARSSSRITPCVKLDTGTDKLWFRCKSKHEEEKWINAIREGCTRYAKPSPIPSHASDRKVTSIWHHENPLYDCQLIDVTDAIPGYSVVVAALFCCKKDKTKNIYSIQCSTKEGGVALEQLDLMEAQYCPQISSICILDCNVLCVSGSSGYLGIAVLGNGGATMPKICSVSCRQYEGHSRNSCVTCLKYSPEKRILISGDIKGGLALWAHSTRGSLTYFGKISLQGCDINDITFHPTENMVLVGTYSKLYLVGIWEHHIGHEKIYRFEGISLLDECGHNSVCCFYRTAFSFTPVHLPDNDRESLTAENDQACGALSGAHSFKMTTWKVETMRRRMSSLEEGDSDTDGDGIPTYSTQKGTIESVLEMQDDTSDYMQYFEEVNLTEQQGLSPPRENHVNHASGKSESELNQFHSRVSRYQNWASALEIAKDNFIPIKRSEGNGNCVNGIENPQGLDASSRTSNVTKSYTTTRHFAEEALAAICSKENTGVNLIFSSAITEK